jgi:hypothetical protein
VVPLRHGGRTQGGDAWKCTRIWLEEKKIRKKHKLSQPFVHRVGHMVNGGREHSTRGLAGCAKARSNTCERGLARSTVRGRQKLKQKKLRKERRSN